MKEDDIKGLAEAMMKLMGDESLRRKMSAYAREVANIYSEEKVMQKWISLFENM